MKWTLKLTLRRREANGRVHAGVSAVSRAAEASGRRRTVGHYQLPVGLASERQAILMSVLANWITDNNGGWTRLQPL